MTHLARLVALVALVGAIGCWGPDEDDECFVTDNAGADIAALQLRDPNTGLCQPFGGSCNDFCEPCPLEGDVQAQPDWGQCFSRCESLDENACKAASGCRAAFAGNRFFQCWAVAASGPIQGGGCTFLDAHACSRHDDCVAVHAIGSPIGSFQSCAPETAIQDPGSCVGPISCDALPPQCPSGTVPGRRNGCWTGYCIPQTDCDELPACELLDEMDCIGRLDCSPTYRGHNCTCTANGCTCQSWTFDTCKTAPML